MLAWMLKRPWGIRTKLVVSLTAINLVGVGLFASLSYRAAESSSLADIDDILCAAADGAQQAVPPIVVNEAEVKERTEPAFTDAYRAAHAELERYAETARLEFVWVIAVRPDDTAFEVVSNLSPEQQAARADPMQALLLNPYDIPAVYLDAARTGARKTGSAVDEYGSFRSCIDPVPLSNGNVILYGADMDVTQVERRLREDLITNTVNGLLVLVGVVVIAVVFSNRMSAELGDVVRDANAISRLRLGAPGPRKVSRTLEVDLLYWAHDDMKKGLRAFSKYVPDAVIGQVLAKGSAEVGGERRELSLMMTDVADFTTISEQLEPERVMVTMSEYFDRVVGPLLDEKATVDKYVGDAIFTYWNAPVAQEDHAARCCRAVLAARQASVNLAKEWEELGRWPWRTRFGLHAGATVFGNVGAPDRMDFTVIGSSVNLASRLEGLNKFYGTEILASQRLRELAGDAFLFRPVDRALPKGAFEPMEIFELIGAFGVPEFEPSADDIDYVRLWTAAITLYRHCDFQAALLSFETLLKTRPTDSVAKLYVRRCHQFLAEPPPPDWDCVQIFETK